MKNISLDYSNIMDFVSPQEIEEAFSPYKEARKTIIEGTGEGADFLGWVNLPCTIDSEELQDIKNTAEQIRQESDVLVCIGIGGSYLGAKAAIEALLPNFYNETGSLKVYFAGQSLSTCYLQDLLALMEGKRVSVNVISKSGTTTEPALAFRIIREWMQKRYGREEAVKRITATTDKERGALKTLADQEGIKTFIIPDDVGGRFSVLTPVGLLPIAAAGIDVDALLQGAAEGAACYKDMEDLSSNPASMYGVLRNILYNKGKTIEILSNFEPQLHYVSEWWKQLFGESEGKNGKGIFPASCDFTTDLHSMGQWIQEGQRNIFETFINIEAANESLVLQEEETNLDKLNFLAGKTLDFVNRQAYLGTSLAHKDGGVPNMTINLPQLSSHCLGKLFYFFEWAVAVSGYMLKVNPFDQPGVESYKKNMFALLDKPGFEKESKQLKEKLAGLKKFVSKSV